MTAKQSVILIKDLVKRFGSFTAVDGLNLTVAEGARNQPPAPRPGLFAVAGMAAVLSTIAFAGFRRCDID